MNTTEEGQKLIAQADWVLEHEARRALDEGNFGLAVRRSQEAVELALKGAVRVLGGDYPKVHDIAPVFGKIVQEKLGKIPETLERIAGISQRLNDARSPSFYMEKDYSSEDATRAYEDARFVLSEVKRILK